MTQLLSLLLQWGPHGPHEPVGPHGPMGPQWGGGMYPWGTGLAGPGFGPLFWLLALATLAALLVGGYLLVRLLVDRRDESSDALRVLERRYASGDIDAEEYDARRSRLVETP